MTTEIGFSANLGFLWTELELPAAIAAAAAAGFDAVECHWPFAHTSRTVVEALQSSGLSMLSLNTWPGDTAAGDFGLAAVPGREAEARQAIDQALDYAAAIGARFVHVMAGKADTNGREVLLGNLAHALAGAARLDLQLLIEPINTRDLPGYHLNRVEQAAELIRELADPRLRLMFDCYHVQVMQGDLTRRLEQHLDLIGHVQIAAVPARNEPDSGEIDYRYLMRALQRMGYRGMIGAEYRPTAGTAEGLRWLASFRDALGS